MFPTSQGANEKVIEDGAWSVWQGISAIEKKLFYYILDPNGSRLYFFLDKSQNSRIATDLRQDAKKYLKDERIPESIKDFIRTLIVLEKL